MTRFLVPFSLVVFALGCGAEPSGLDSTSSSVLFEAPLILGHPVAPTASADDAATLVDRWSNEIRISCGRCHAAVENPTGLARPVGPKARVEDVRTLIDRWLHRVEVGCGACHSRIPEWIRPEGTFGPEASANASRAVVEYWSHLRQSDCETCHGQLEPETGRVPTPRVMAHPADLPELMESGSVHGQRWCQFCHLIPEVVRPFRLEAAQLANEPTPVQASKVRPDMSEGSAMSLLDYYWRIVPREGWPDNGPPPPPTRSDCERPLLETWLGLHPER